MVESRLTVSSVALEDSGVYKCASDAASRGAKVAVVVTSGEFFFRMLVFLFHVQNFHGLRLSHHCK